LKEYEVRGWVGLFAPRSAATTVCQHIAADVSAALKSPLLLERYASLGFEAPEITLQSFSDLIQRETDAWAGVIRAAAVHLD
jgi:tripartite-type tricarboxylate transporter receptor subunit TctC